MKKRSIALYIILTIIGLALIVVGLDLVRSHSDATLPYLCIGVGCGVFGHGLGELFRCLAAKRAPEAAKQEEILANDERNIAIQNRADAKAYHSMVYIFGALMIAFALMNVEMRVIILLVLAYLFVCGISIFYRIKYYKEM